MSNYSPSENRRRWEDGTMSEAEWTNVIEEYLAKDKENNGKVSPVPFEWDTTYSFPINESYVTEDFIRRFANAIGNPDPLFHDPGYGKKTMWGSMIAPPAFAASIANPGYFPEKAEIPGWVAFYGGTEHINYKVIRPGDKFRVINKYLGFEEKTKPGKPYRLFTPRNQRTYINQYDEIVAVGIGNEVVTATPPGMKRGPRKDPYENRKRHQYTKDELDMIHSAYDEELEGKWRRGALTRYWEDVIEGEELHPVIKGPLDVSDAGSWLGMRSSGNMAFAIKYKALKPDLGRAIIDPETGEHHNAIDWHYLDSMARVTGLPYAISNGAQNEAIIGHLLSNWMGDDGFVRRLFCEHRGVWFHGETLWVKGKVTRKYVENGQHLIDIDAWSENIFDSNIKCTIANATVKLLSKAE